MSTVFVNDEYLSDIADAIRAKLSVQTTYKPSEMAAAIESIETGSSILITSQPSDFTGNVNDTASFTVVASGTGLTYQWQYKSLVDGMWYNTTTVVGYNTATMSITVTNARNGMQFRCKITDNNENTVISNPATLRVTQAEPVLISKTITENGTYTASDDSADGYSAVTVSVTYPTWQGGNY